MGTVSDSQGFGFTVTGRDTAKGERLFYIGTVKPDGAAFGVLRAGDRLLEVSFHIIFYTEGYMKDGVL